MCSCSALTLRTKVGLTLPVKCPHVAPPRTAPRPRSNPSSHPLHTAAARPLLTSTQSPPRVISIDNPIFSKTPSCPILPFQPCIMRARQEWRGLALEPMTRASTTETHSPENLDVQHFRILQRAVSNLLITDAAELAYASIVDGLPTLAQFLEFHDLSKQSDHPVTRHEALCDGVIEKVRAFRSNFDLRTLKFEPYARQISPNTRSEC